MRAEVFLAVALAIAVATGWGAYVYLEEMVETQDVVVVRDDLPIYAELAAADLAVKAIPAAAVHRNAIMDVSDAAGRVLARPVTAGQTLLTSDLLSDGDDGGPLGQLEPLERAVRVAADRLTGAGPQLQRGSRVDLIFVGGGQQDSVARTLLQGVEILELEHQETRTGDKLLEAVIFRLDLPEAERLAFGLHRGDLRLVMNGHRARPALTPGVRADDLFDAAVIDQTTPPLFQWPPDDGEWEEFYP